MPRSGEEGGAGPAVRLLPDRCPTARDNCNDETVPQPSFDRGKITQRQTESGEHLHFISRSSGRKSCRSQLHAGEQQGPQGRPQARMLCRRKSCWRLLQPLCRLPVPAAFTQSISTSSYGRSVILDTSYSPTGIVMAAGHNAMKLKQKSNSITDIYTQQ